MGTPPFTGGANPNDVTNQKKQLTIYAERTGKPPRPRATACSSSGGTKPMKSDSPEDMIATTIERLDAIVETAPPAAMMPAMVKAAKDDLVLWLLERDTGNISDSTAVKLIRELSDRNDDAVYRQAVQEIVNQCD